MIFRHASMFSFTNHKFCSIGEKYSVRAKKDYEIFLCPRARNGWYRKYSSEAFGRLCDVYIHVLKIVRRNVQQHQAYSLVQLLLLKG